MLRAGKEATKQLRSPATVAFAHSLSREGTVTRERTATAKMLAHTDYRTVKIYQGDETAALAGNPACTDTTAVKLYQRTRGNVDGIISEAWPGTRGVLKIIYLFQPRPRKPTPNCSVRQTRAQYSPPYAMTSSRR
eukprot:6211923-Pleurochrysis_carterae.AAC.4